MLGEELVMYIRESVLDDVAVPHLWSTPELLRNLNYAEVQACRRAHLIIDGTTDNDNGTAGSAGTAGQKPLCELEIVAEQATYNLSPRILQIKRCQVKSMTYPLIGPVSYAELDERMSGWVGTNGTVGTAGSGGVPTFFINEPGNTITFVRSSSVNDSAALVVSRLPLTPFTLQTSPEIDEKYHLDLVNWAAHLAYLKNDSDTLNLQLAGMYDGMFTQSFGMLPDAYSDRMRKVLSQQQRMRPRPFGS